MLTIVCVLKSGGIYDATWVDRLKRGVNRWSSFRYRFVCLSDVDVPCERLPLEHDWPGWWSKVEALALDGPALYFDLDTAIVGDLSDIAEAAYMAPFATLRDFYRDKGLGSGVMSWNRNDVSACSFYDMFLFDPRKWINTCPGGDQEFLEKVAFLPGVMRLQDAVPDQIVSYKVHCSNGIPPNARVVCLHGKPKFADMPANDPVRLAWEMAA